MYVRRKTNILKIFSGLPYRAWLIREVHSQREHDLSSSFVTFSFAPDISSINGTVLWPDIWQIIPALLFFQHSHVAGPAPPR